MSTIETNLLYFFSTLAQCSAAFAALAGVFAVFRLQWNESHIQEAYRRGNYWLSRQDQTHFHDSTPKYRIKERLDGWSQSTDKPAALEAKELLGAIQQRENETGKIGNALSMPLKMWFLIFFLSLAILPFLHWYEGIPGFIVITLFLLFVFFAGIITAKFVQTCLSSPKLDNKRE
ncbi:MAG: hypothetical protein WC484_01800 [Candidatus Omnitrophota bacterium]